MKAYFLSTMLLVGLLACAGDKTYTGSTPAHYEVRQFLGISLTDSIDFIRWKLRIEEGHYEVDCRYGLARPGTPGFEDEKQLHFSGDLRKEQHYFYLHHQGKTLSVLEVNFNLLHLVDSAKHFLVGNGGYSYALNSASPVPTDAFYFPPQKSKVPTSMAFEGRTPCQELSSLLGLGKRSVCDKLKWYFIFYADSVTGAPSHYLSGGTAYRTETMARGKWQILEGRDGRIVYKLNPDNQAYSIYLLKADENILFFTDAEGRLLVGNENFSYTLNRRTKAHSRIR